MPYFEVPVTASVMCLVKADDEATAVSRAYNEADFDTGDKETQPARLLRSEEEIARSRRLSGTILD